MATGIGKKYKYTMASLLTEWTNHEGGYLHQKFSILNNRSFDDPSDAEALCAALRNPRADDLDGDPKEFWLNSDPAWYTIAWKMYRASESINMIIRSHGLPQLKRRLELALSETAIWQQQARGEDVTYRFLNGEACHYIFLLSLLVLNQDSDATSVPTLTLGSP